VAQLGTSRDLLLLPETDLHRTGLSSKADRANKTTLRQRRARASVWTRRETPCC